MRKSLIQEIAEKVERLRANDKAQALHEAKAMRKSNTKTLDETRRMQRLAGIITESFEDVPVDEEY